MRLPDGLLSWRVWVHVLLIRPFMRLFFGVSVTGRQHLAELDQFIVVANHNSHLDTFLLFHALPLGRICCTRPVAARRYFAKHRVLFRLLDGIFRPVWVDRRGRGRDALDAMRDELDRGHSLIIFPEGTRGEPGRIGTFRTGIGKLATEYPHIPTVPVLLSGTEKALPKNSVLPVPIWNNVTVGPPHAFTGSRRDITVSLEALVRELADAEAAERHARRGRRHACVTVAVLGIDGSGKSTVSRRLAARLSATAKACCVSDGLLVYEAGERRDAQPLLTEWMREAIGAYAKTARSLKHYKIPKMAELLLRSDVVAKAERWYCPSFILCDGHPLLNLAAWAALYNEDGLDTEDLTKAIHVLAARGEDVPRGDPMFRTFPELTMLKRLGLAHIPLPEIIVMLDVDPAVCVSRISSRGEARQVHETQEKLAHLRAGYLRVCRIVEAEFGVPTLIADGGRPLEAVVSSVMAFVDRRIQEMTGDR